MLLGTNIKHLEKDDRFYITFSIYATNLTQPNITASRTKMSQIT